MLQRACLIVTGLLFIGASALAESHEEVNQSADQGGWAVRGGIGFMASPEAFLMNFEGEYRFPANVALGAAMQLGLKSKLTVVSPVAYGRYIFAMDQASSEQARRLEPYLQFGTGLTHRDRDSRGDDTGFLLNFGGGLDYRLDDSVSVGTRMLFNFVPGNVFGDAFYFSWEMASFRWHF